jgi:glutathionylspermidine synthase
MVFSSLDWHSEDAGTTRYLLKCSQVNASFVPLQNLRLYKDKLCALIENQLLPIDILYRLHPLGVLSSEKDVDGFPTGAAVLKLVAEGKLAFVNPPSAIIAQTKALQALIWNLHELGEYFTQEQHEIIESYMIPTYFENPFLGKTPYVVKPILGREGGGIGLYTADGGVLTRDVCDDFSEQLVIYQQMVELENIKIETLQGMYEGYLLWGAFLLNGKASAINARVGGRITNDKSYFLPICIA